VAPSETYSIFLAAFALIGLGAAASNCWALTQTAVPGEMIGRIIGIQNFIATWPGFWRRC